MTCSMKGSVCVCACVWGGGGVKPSGAPSRSMEQKKKNKVVIHK